MTWLSEYLVAMIPVLAQLVLTGTGVSKLSIPVTDSMIDRHHVLGAIDETVDERRIAIRRATEAHAAALNSLAAVREYLDIFLISSLIIISQTIPRWSTDGNLNIVSIVTAFVPAAITLVFAFLIPRAILSKIAKITEPASFSLTMIQYYIDRADLLLRNEADASENRQGFLFRNTRFNRWKYYGPLLFSGFVLLYYWLVLGA